MKRYDSEFPPYVSVAERRARATAQMERLKKKNPSIHPIMVSGRKLAETWWGQAWNQNLENYADFRYRIQRGRTYVRHGAVLDLQMSPGLIQALVQGSQSQPYRVKVEVKPLNQDAYSAVTASMQGTIGSLAELLHGQFPKELGALFTKPREGLFPAPEEIAMTCTCPDWATLCKHVAATLYGVGVRVDEDPKLFFTLRGVNLDALIGQAVIHSTHKAAQVDSSRVIKGDDVASLFDIDLDDQ